MKETTNVAELKRGAPFTWGAVIKIHEIGEYGIVEFHPWQTEGCKVLTGLPNYNRRGFHGSINGTI